MSRKMHNIDRRKKNIVRRKKKVKKKKKENTQKITAIDTLQNFQRFLLKASVIVESFILSVAIFTDLNLLPYQTAIIQ